MNLLFTSQDPGAIQTLVPVIKKLHLQKPDDKYYFAVPDLDGNHRILNKIPTHCEILELQKINLHKTIFEQIHPKMVLTGSSNPHKDCRATAEQSFHALCKKYRIPSICILDFWGDYGRRFADCNGVLNPQYIPTKICALDEISKKNLLSLGIDSSKIVITHNPYFDSIVEECKEALPSKKDPDTIRILYVSQALHEKNRKKTLGYDQFTNFLALIEGLSYWPVAKKKKIFIWIHPLENDTDWNWNWNQFITASQLDFCTSISTERSKSFIEKIDLVCSAYSTSLYRFLYHSIPCMSLQVGLRKKDQLITNQLGLTVPIYDRKKLKKEFSELDLTLLTKRLAKRKKTLSKQGIFFSQGSATQKVLKVIQSLIQNTSGSSLAS